MIKKMLSSVVTSILLLICFFGYASAGLIFESYIPVLPTGKVIIIDGNADDWADIPVFVNDIPQRDTLCEEGTDFKELYLSKDDTYIY